VRLAGLLLLLTMMAGAVTLPRPQVDRSQENLDVVTLADRGSGRFSQVTAHKAQAHVAREIATRLSKLSAVVKKATRITKTHMLARVVAEKHILAQPASKKQQTATAVKKSTKAVRDAASASHRSKALLAKAIHHRRSLKHNIRMRKLDYDHAMSKFARVSVAVGKSKIRRAKDALKHSNKSIEAAKRRISVAKKTFKKVKKMSRIAIKQTKAKLKKKKSSITAQANLRSITHEQQQLVADARRHFESSLRTEEDSIDEHKKTIRHANAALEKGKYLLQKAPAHLKAEKNKKLAEFKEQKQSHTQQALALVKKARTSTRTALKRKPNLK